MAHDEVIISMELFLIHIMPVQHTLKDLLVKENKSEPKVLPPQSPLWGMTGKMQKLKVPDNVLWLK